MRIMKFGIVTRFEKLKIRRFIVENAVSLRIECSDGDKRVLWCFVFTLSVDSLTRLFVCCSLRDFSPTRNQSQRKNNIIIIIIVVYCIYRIVSLCGVTFVVILLIFPLVLLVRIRIIIIIHRSYLRCRRVSKWVKSVSSTIYFYILVWVCVCFTVSVLVLKLERQSPQNIHQ